LATRLETDFGFGSLGLLCLAGIGNRDLLMFDKLRAAVGATIDRAYATALDLLSKNQRALDALAAALFAAGYLDQAEIEEILVQTPLRSQANTPAPAAYSVQSATVHGEPAVAVADTAAVIPSGIVDP
jgi:cell division protease FtsH